MSAPVSPARTAFLTAARERILILDGAMGTMIQALQFDEAAFRSLVNWQIDEGTNGLVPVGTTGESPTLSHDEHKQVVEWCIAEAKGRVPVIAGAGSNSTREAVELAEHAEKAGADAVLVNTAIAVADDPVMMARAFRLAVEAGLLARGSGPGSRSFQAQATSPLTSFLEAIP